jgi:hypothetical protein
VVLVARDQLAQLLLTLRETLRSQRFRILDVEPHCGNLVDHEKAERVGELHGLFGVRIV